MFSFKTIQIKTLVLVFSVFALFLTIHAIYEFNKIKVRTFETLDKMNTTINTIVVEYTSAYVYNEDIVNLQKTVDAIKSDYVKSIYILDKNANIIVKSKKSTLGTTKHPKFDTLLNSKNSAIKNTKEYIVLNTFDILGVPIGYMILEADLQTYHNHIDEEIDKLIFDALFWIVTFFILSMLIAKSLSNPIQKIIDRLRLTGDSEVLEFPNQPQAEFRFLSLNIARTHNRLRLSNETLEAKVSEKTHELQELNRVLENKVREEVLKNQKKDKQMLQQSRLAQMGEMISMIAHQWRQPLGAISATASNIEMKIELESFDLNTKKGQNEQNKYFIKKLHEIGGFVQNLTVTIDDFRNFYKPNKASVEVSIEDVVTKSLNIIKASLENDNIKLIYEYNSKEKFKMYDSEMMQVILNIIKNAQDNFREKSLKDTASHNIENPQIKIMIERRKVDICDNGGGISEDIVDRIFDPYFSTKDEKNGTGLGLYMSKIIVEEHHNGKLNVINKEGGVCFEIELNESV